jgi:hypothetical protein
MTTEHMVVQTPAERAAMLPNPVPGMVITVPLDLLPAYYDLHKLVPVKWSGDRLLVKPMGTGGQQ